MFAIALVLLLSTPARAGDCDKVAGEAMDEYVRAKFEKASALARTVLDLGPSPCRKRALRILGAAGCFLHDPVAPQEAIAELDGMDRLFIKQVCKQNGVSVELSCSSTSQGDAGEAALCEATNQYVRLNHTGAIEAARAALASPAAHDKAWRIIAASACFQQDPTTVREACAHLAQPKDRQFIEEACRRNRVAVRCGCVSPQFGAASDSEREANRRALARAREALSAGKYAEAVKAAREPQLGCYQEGMVIAVEASCKLRDVATAVTTAAKIVCKDSFAEAERTCRAAGIQLPPRKHPSDVYAAPQKEKPASDGGGL